MVCCVCWRINSVVISHWLSSGVRGSMCSWMTMMTMWVATKGQLLGLVQVWLSAVLWSWLYLCVVVAEKSRAFSPHGEAKKQALGPDDLRTYLGRPLTPPFPMSPRDLAKISHDQHSLQFNCESSSLSYPVFTFLTCLSFNMYYEKFKQNLYLLMLKCL